MKKKYELPLPYSEVETEFTRLVITNTTMPCYLKMFAEEGSFKLMNHNYDFIYVQVKTMPAYGTIYF